MIRRLPACFAVAQPAIADVVAGAYVAWYGWVEIRALSGGPAGDPVVAAAIEVQAAVTDLVANLGAVGLLVLAAVLAAGIALLARHRPSAS